MLMSSVSFDSSFFLPKLGSLNFPRVSCPAFLIFYRKSIFNAYTVREEKSFVKYSFTPSF